MSIHRTEKDGGCTFYHNTDLAHLTEPLVHIQSHMFMQVIPVLTKLCMHARLEVFRPFLCVFMSRVLGFSCAKNYG